MSHDYSLAEFVLRELVFKQEDEYVLHPKAEQGFRIALDDIFRSDLDPKEQVEGVAKLGALMEWKYQAFEVADGIAALLAGDDRALGLLGLPPGHKARALMKLYGRLSCAEPERNAPRYGAAAPAGSLKASSFFQPGRELRSRRAKL
jgi:hypothetical protein